MASLQNEAYRVVGFCGSRRMSVAPNETVGAGLSRVQLTPPSWDCQMPYVEWIGGDTRRAPPRPRRIAAYRWSASFGSTASRAVDTPTKKSPETWLQVAPPSVDFRMPLP